MFMGLAASAEVVRRRVNELLLGELVYRMMERGHKARDVSLLRGLRGFAIVKLYKTAACWYRLES
jgi:hypothetical protein